MFHLKVFLKNVKFSVIFSTFLYIALANFVVRFITILYFNTLVNAVFWFFFVTMKWKGTYFSMKISLKKLQRLFNQGKIIWNYLKAWTSSTWKPRMQDFAGYSLRIWSKINDL